MYRVKEIAEKVAREAAGSGKISMFSIANTANKNNASLLFPAIRETDSTIAGNVLVTSVEQIRRILEMIDGVVDIILTDAEIKTSGLEDAETVFQRGITKSRRLTFKPNDLTADALDALLAQLVFPLFGKKATVIGAGNVGSKIALKLVERGVHVVLTRRNEKTLQKIVEGINAVKPVYSAAKVTGTSDNVKACQEADVIIGATAGTAVVTKEMVAAMKASGYVIDAGNGTVFPEALQEAENRNISVLCLFVKPAYDGALKTVMKTQELLGKMKRRPLDDFFILSGGILGKRGDVIVDDVRCPKRILAVADGRGDVIPDIRDPVFQKNIEAVEAMIKERGQV